MKAEVRRLVVQHVFGLLAGIAIGVALAPKPPEPVKPVATDIGEPTMRLWSDWQFVAGFQCKPGQVVVGMTIKAGLLTSVNCDDVARVVSRNTIETMSPPSTAWQFDEHGVVKKDQPR